jgi:hypothetical protein
MKTGAENRKKTIMAGAFGAVALCCAFYAYSALYGGPPNPAAQHAAAPVVVPAAGSVKTASRTQTAGPANGSGLGAAPGVAAKKMASTAGSLDPTLDETAMLRTESLVYSGTGRNIFSLVYVPPAAVIPTNVPSARMGPTGQPPPPPPPATCPPSCPPINLKFFGTAMRTNGVRQAFLLQGEDVYLASKDDIVARKYRIVSISANSIQVEDLTNHNTQTLPLQAN